MNVNNLTTNRTQSQKRKRLQTIAFKANHRARLIASPADAGTPIGATPPIREGMKFSPGREEAFTRLRTERGGHQLPIGLRAAAIVAYRRHHHPILPLSGPSPLPYNPLSGTGARLVCIRRRRKR